MRKEGGRAVAAHADVSKAADSAAMIAVAEREFGRLHVLFNNAGIMHAQDDDAVTTEEAVWDLTMNINAKGVFFGCKYGIPALQRAGGGSIINTASFVALMGAATPQIAYTASKGAVLAMTRELAVIHARENIRVNALCPGPLRTKLLMGFLDTERQTATPPGSHPDGPLRRSARDRERSAVPRLRRVVLHDGHRVPGRRRHHGGLRHATMSTKERIQTAISPVDGSVFVERTLASDSDVEAALARAAAAQKAWAQVPVAERAEIVRRMVGVVPRTRGRRWGRSLRARWDAPIARSPNEMRRGFCERASYMAEIADHRARRHRGWAKPDFHRFIRREPLGVVLVLAPWNFPWLTSVNAVVPALLAGNASS